MKEKQVREGLATLHGYRCDALYEVGAYDAAVKDARSSLEYEQLARESFDDRPYSTSPDRLDDRDLLHPEKGSTLRAKVLCSLGYSLLRGGNVDCVKESFQESVTLAKKALEDAADFTEGERMISHMHKIAVGVLNETIEKATEGLATLSQYESLQKKLGSSSQKKKYLDTLDSALEIAPGATDWHVAKVKHLIGRKRWFAVANHCEQVAANAAKYDGLFKGDLAELNPYPGIPAIVELDAKFFRESKNKNDAPPHLRTLSIKATRDAVFRMPKELLPHYLRALRLEERYKEAVLVGTALAEFDAQTKSDGKDTFAENKRFHQEWDMLDRTIKLKEEGKIV